MRFTELFKLLVIRKKVMTMTEFFDADAFTIDLVLTNLEDADRDSMERMRNLVWAILAPYSKKKGLAPNDVMRFKWEEQDRDPSVTTKETFDSIAKKHNLNTL